MWSNDTTTRVRPAWTPRERQVLDLIAAGRTNGEIAEARGISFATAKWHVSELISKLGVSSREEVAAHWRRERSPRGRLRAAFRALASASVMKVAGGAAAAAAVAGTAVVAYSAFPHGSEQNIPALADATPTATPTQQNTLVYVQPTTGCATRPAGTYCPRSNYPAVVALDKGDCDFSGETLALIPDIDLSGCDLRGVTLSMANGANFAGADLRGARLVRGTAGSANMTGADLRDADLSHSILQDIDFKDANLLGAKFEDSIVLGSRWRNTTCPDGTNSDANGGTCEGTAGMENLPTTRATGTPVAWPSTGPCPEAGATGSPLPGHRCTRDRFAVLVDAGADATACLLTGANLGLARLDYADLAGCTLAGADLHQARLNYATLARANLQNADLHEARLMGADLSGANLQGANLAGALLANANVTDANFFGANLTGAMLQAFWANTICPDGTNSDDNGGSCRTTTPGTP